nr:SprT-like domain-containing protein [Polynucleobacter necessarius]
MVHELCHAVDDCFSGHGDDFKGIAQTVGLEGPARMAHATEELTVKLMMISQELEPYPHQAIVFPPPRPSNVSRSKAKCAQCGYEVTLLKKWASYGAPICPKDNIRMQEAVPETIENTADYDSESVGKGAKQSPDEIRRAIS